jgi:hypothetical protein
MLYAPAQIKEPLLAKNLTTKPKATVKEVYEYDVQTTEGGEYRFYKKGTMTGINSPLGSAALRSKELSTFNSQLSTYYDLQGRPTTKDAKGIVIERRTIDGKNTYRKIIKH